MMIMPGLFRYWIALSLVATNAMAFHFCSESTTSLSWNRIINNNNKHKIVEKSVSSSRIRIVTPSKRRRRVFEAQQNEYNENGDETVLEETPSVEATTTRSTSTDPLNGDENNNKNGNDPILLQQKADEFRQLLPLWFAFVAFWPALTAGRIFFATHEFDVDTYLTLQSILPPQQQEETLFMDNNNMIMELPPLSPAERIVDAFFGPNRVDRRGF